MGTEGDVKAAIEAVERLHGHKDLKLGNDRVAVMVPKGMDLRSIKFLIDEYRDCPERREGTARLDSLESFIEWSLRFKQERSAIFASGKSHGDASLTAVIDYHAAGADGEPSFCKHRGVYSCPASDEWLAWLGKDGKPMSQSDFADFIEDHLTDIANPAAKLKTIDTFAEQHAVKIATPSQMLDLSKGLEVNVGRKVVQRVSQQSGEARLSFEESHSGSNGQPLSIPGAFALLIPVFRCGGLYPIPIRLRYRIKDTEVLWTFTMHRADRVFQHAFDEACEQAASGTELPLYRGKPEA